MMSVLKLVISRCKNEVVATGQLACKCPHLYHCQEILSMTKVTNCPYNVHSWADRSKCYCVLEYSG